MERAVEIDVRMRVYAYVYACIWMYKLGAVSGSYYAIAKELITSRQVEPSQK